MTFFSVPSIDEDDVSSVYVLFPLLVVTAIAVMGLLTLLLIRYKTIIIFDNTKMDSRKRSQFEFNAFISLHQILK